MGGMDLKQDFRDLLQASGWSQAEAARQLAMTPSALSQIVRENSPVRPSLVTLRLFGLLLWGKKPEAGRKLVRPRRKGRAEKWEQDLIRALRRLPPNTRRPILNVLYAMIEAARSKQRPRKRKTEINQTRKGKGEL
jgi:transcriptional regulator with XRE-family HTH domain